MTVRKQGRENILFGLISNINGFQINAICHVVSRDMWAIVSVRMAEE